MSLLFVCIEKQSVFISTIECQFLFHLGFVIVLEMS